MAFVSRTSPLPKCLLAMRLTIDRTTCAGVACERLTSVGRRSTRERQMPLIASSTRSSRKRNTTAHLTLVQNKVFLLLGHWWHARLRHLLGLSNVMRCNAIFCGDMSCPTVLDRDTRSSAVALRVRSGQEVRQDSQPHARCPLEDDKRNVTLGDRGVRWYPNTGSLLVPDRFFCLVPPFGHVLRWFLALKGWLAIAFVTNQWQVFVCF